jgi:hypothetical protein
MKLLLISGLTVIVGYIVIQKTNFEVSTLWKKDKNEKVLKQDESPDNLNVSLERKRKIDENPFKKEFKASKNSGNSRGKGLLKREEKKKESVISVVPVTGKPSAVTQKSKKEGVFKSGTSREKSNFSVSTVSKSDKEKKEKSKKDKVEKKVKAPTAPVVSVKKEVLGEDEESASQSSSKKSKKIIINHPPLLSKVEEVSVSEIDLDDIEIDINDIKTKKDRDRNGDKITYSCTFTSINREKGMLSKGLCDDIEDVNFSFEQDTGRLRWILNEPGSTISGNYEFKIEGSDGVSKDSTLFKVNISDGNSSEPENNTSQVLESAMAGSETFGNPLNLKEKTESK